jgi:hypothetical protein
MITKANFTQIDNEVKNSLEEAFAFLKTKCVDHNYILFLADGELKEKYEGFNPYSIDNREDRYKDQTRLNFFIKFMETFYSFKNVNQTDDNEFRLTMELMIYTHIWESKPFLKQLYRLASLANGKSYEWYVEVPEMSKHNYIREDIRNILKTKKLKLSSVISKGFHTSLRNAFAHSEYQFDEHNKQIHLDTYKGGAWDISKISYDDWTKRFVYTALLSYHFLNVKAQKRKSLPVDFGRDKYLIIHPITQTRFRVSTIHYELKYDRFYFGEK